MWMALSWQEFNVECWGLTGQSIPTRPLSQILPLISKISLILYGHYRNSTQVASVLRHSWGRFKSQGTGGRFFFAPYMLITEKSEVCGVYCFYTTSTLRATHIILAMHWCAYTIHILNKVFSSLFWHTPVRRCFLWQMLYRRWRFRQFGMSSLNYVQWPFNGAPST